MYSLEECILQVNAVIGQMNLPPVPANLYEPIRYAMGAGGKRIRPALTIMACNLFSDSVDDAINPAIAIEMFHNFTLLHDDIMDRSEMRRNRPTVHKKWSENVAILSGDALMIKAYEYLAMIRSSKLPAILTIFNNTALKVCEGQQLDMDYESLESISVEEYLHMIELKTAILMAGALKIGAVCGTAPEKDAILLHEFGRNLGIAFQLQDDLLDVFANPETFGKSPGNDIVSNKKTFLLLTAFEKAPMRVLKELRNLTSTPVKDRTKKIAQASDIFNQLNIKKLTEDKIDLYYSKAFENLHKISVSDARKKILADTATSLIGREK